LETSTRQDGTIADPEKLSPFLRKAHFAAERDKLKLRTETGELIPCGEVEKGYKDLLDATSTVYDMNPLPPILIDEKDLEPEVFEDS
jgi:Protein of unknown function (DUF1441)